MLQNIKGIGPANKPIGQPAEFQKPNHTKMYGDASSIQQEISTSRQSKPAVGTPLHEQFLLSEVPKPRLYRSE